MWTMKLPGPSWTPRVAGALHSPQEQLNPCSLVKSTETKAECRRAAPWTQRPLLQPPTLPVASVTLQALRLQNPASGLQAPTTLGKVLFQGHNLLIDKLNSLKKHLLSLPTAFENLDHVLDLETLGASLCLQGSQPSFFASSSSCPLAHRCSQGSLLPRAPLLSWLQGTSPLECDTATHSITLMATLPPTHTQPPPTAPSQPLHLCKFCPHPPGGSPRFKPLFSLDSSSSWLPTLSPNGINPPITAQIWPHSHCSSYYHLQG